MKLTIHFKLALSARGAKCLSIACFVGLSLLTCTVVGQQTPRFAPGSTSNQPFSLLEQSSVVESWEPPATDVQSSPSDWSPPVTNAAAVIQPPVTIEAIEPVIEQPALGSAVESFPKMELQTPEVLPLPGSVRAVPQDSELTTGESPSIIRESVPNAVTETLPLDSSFDLESNVGQSVITNEFDSDESFDAQPMFGDTFEPSTVVGEESFEAVEGQEPVVNEAAPSGRVLAGGLGNQVDGPQLRTPVRNILGSVNTRLAGNNGVYAVGQLTLLSLSRDYRGKGRILSNGAPNLLANGPDEGDFTGVDLSYGRRRAGGQGWEMRYFGFNPDQATDVSGSSPTLVWGGLTPPLNDPQTWGGAIPNGTPQTYGLSGIGLGGFSMADVFNDASNHRVSRDSEFGSFEFNFLRASAGGQRLSCGGAMVEFFGGLRGVSFKETTTFTARATQSAFLPQSAFYASEVQNSLFGLQIGGRIERQRKNGWSTSFGSRVGIYNNRVESRQHAQYQFADGSTATPTLLFGDDAGREFDFDGKDNELAFLGELDFGLIYQFRPRTRARVGYRGIAVTNIADSAGQLEDSLFDSELVEEPKAWGDLIVGGFYFGVDHAF